MESSYSGINQSERVALTELNTLKKGEKEEGEVVKPRNELEAKETEKQRITGPVEEESEITVVARYSYEKRTDEDISLSTDDKLAIINKDDGDWWFCRSLKTGEEGYIPSNHVAPVGSIEAQEWFFGKISRVEADKQLMMSFNQYGSFLVREVETTHGDYNLSIRDQERVRHYRIKHLEDGTFFVIRQVTFPTISDLVAYYQQQADGLCVNLMYPCQLSEKPQTAGLSKQANEKWEIDRKQIRLMKSLGAGHFGRAWEGLWNGTTPVAVKSLKSEAISPAKFLIEAALMKKLHHSKLVQFYAVCTKSEPYIYVITELMKCSVLEFLKGKRRSLKLPQLIDMSAQAAAGMAYLEQQNYIHRNLAARNILVGEHMICKVTDFGLARVIGAKTSIRWTAPEAAMFNWFSIKSDVWSYGIVLYEVITYGHSPYPGMTISQVLEALQQGYRMSRPKDCPDKLYEIMLDCWREEPAKRPNFETLQWQMEEFFTYDGRDERRFGIQRPALQI